MLADETLDKGAVVRLYAEILARGCLDAAQRTRVLAGQPVPGLVIQESSGSSGGATLRLPKARVETDWLVEQLVSLHRARRGAGPERVAFVGGVTHLQAGRVAGLFPGATTRSFELREWPALLEFQPDFLSCYASVARDHVVRSAPRLRQLATLKLGGETVLPADRARLLALLPSVRLIEQFGSTEMPGVAFRTADATGDAGWRLSRDRYELQHASDDGWHDLVVRDTLRGRAFPIPGWYRTGDEVRLARGRPVELRRRGDPAAPYLAALDELVARGLTQVQLDLRTGRLLHQGPLALPARVVLGDRAFAAERTSILRLRDSNKAPLVLGPGVDDARLWRTDDPSEARA